MTRPNGKTASLDHRIAAALGNENVGLPALRALLTEAEETRTKAKQIVEAEIKLLFDPANPEPDDRRLQRSKLTVERLNAAIPQLQSRVKRLEMLEYRQVWNEKADTLEKTRNELAEELRQTYPDVLDALIGIFRDADAVSVRIDELHRTAPVGESRRLISPELKARGLAHHDAQHPPLRELLRLPAWDISRTIAFPPDPVQEWNQRALAANEAMATRMREKFATAGSANWSAAQDDLIRQQEAEHAKRDAELQAKRLEEKRIYEQKLREMK